MAYVHEFGIIARIEEVDDIGYDPKTYSCITVDGEFMDDLRMTDFGTKIANLQTFAHSTDRPYHNLCYCGITLIPPTSLAYFLRIVREANDEYNAKELENLIEKIAEALKENKWMVHFGV